MNERRVPRTHAESLAATERDLREEMANALARMGSLLEEQCATLVDLAQLIATLPPGPDRTDHLTKYEDHRKKAERYLWFMVVQREALGLTDHTALHENYKIPGPMPI